MRSSAALFVIVLAGCVDMDPVGAQTPPAVQALVSEAGDSLRLLSDGTFRAKPAGGVDGGLRLNSEPVTFWVVGTWRRDGGRICARPNYFAFTNQAMHCGAVQRDGTIADVTSVFLWDQRARTWAVR